MVCDLEFDSCPPEPTAWRPKDVFRNRSGEAAPETPKVELDMSKKSNAEPEDISRYLEGPEPVPSNLSRYGKMVAQAFLDGMSTTVTELAKQPFQTDLNTILNLHDDLTSEAHNLVARKGRDYNRTEQEGGDTLANLKVAAKLGLVETPAHGVLVRLMDKIMRLKSLCKPGEKPANADEKVKDTVVDVINYAIYVYALHLEAGGE